MSIEHTGLRQIWCGSFYYLSFSLSSSYSNRINAITERSIICHRRVSYIVGHGGRLHCERLDPLRIFISYRGVYARYRYVPAKVMPIYPDTIVDESLYLGLFVRFGKGFSQIDSPTPLISAWVIPKLRCNSVSHALVLPVKLLLIFIFHLKKCCIGN